jgi:hypothetical protein
MLTIIAMILSQHSSLNPYLLFFSSLFASCKYEFRRMMKIPFWLEPFIYSAIQKLNTIHSIRKKTEEDQHDYRWRGGKTFVLTKYFPIISLAFFTRFLFVVSVK